MLAPGEIRLHLYWKPLRFRAFGVYLVAFYAIPVVASSFHIWPILRHYRYVHSEICGIPQLFFFSCRRWRRGSIYPRTNEPANPSTDRPTDQPIKSTYSNRSTNQPTVVNQPLPIQSLNLAYQSLNQVTNHPTDNQSTNNQSTNQ